jgi:hypothetical protein
MEGAVMIQDKAHLAKLVNESFLEGILRSLNTDQMFPIYHYTSTDGLIGILSRKEIWLGNVDDLNDITELNYGFDQVIIPTIKASSDISDESKEKLLSLIELVRNKNFSLAKGNDAYKCDVNIFIFSTSANGNAYTMWNNYTKNDNKAGYAISMDNTDVTTAIDSATKKAQNKSDNEIKNFLISGKIVYTKKEQIALTNQYLGLLEYNLGDKSDEFKEIVYNSFVEGLLVLSLFMKDDEFSKEEEYRYAILLADEITDMDDSHKFYIKFINVNGTIMSRLVVPFDSSFVKEIVASPYISDQDKVAQQLQFFAKKCGIPNVEIKTNISKKIR